jgi:hypothetical protein
MTNLNCSYVLCHFSLSACQLERQIESKDENLNHKGHKGLGYCFTSSLGTFRNWPRLAVYCADLAVVNPLPCRDIDNVNAEGGCSDVISILATVVDGGHRGRDRLRPQLNSFTGGGAESVQWVVFFIARHGVPVH